MLKLNLRDRGKYIIMKISPVSNTQFKARELGAIESLLKQGKPVIVSPEVEQKIIAFMQGLAEEQILEEYKTIEAAKKIILNA